MKIQFVENVPENARPSARRPRSSSSAAPTSSSAPPSAIRTPSRNWRPSIRTWRSSTARAPPTAPTCESFYGRTYESQYLCGMAAGAASKSGKLGFVAANPFGVVNWTINAFALGAQKMNPNATVTVIYTGAWNDPVKERAAAAALIEQGADVIGQHVDSPTPQIVAQETRRLRHRPPPRPAQFAPKATLCSSVWVWDRFLRPSSRRSAGEWKPAPYGAFIADQGRAAPTSRAAAAGSEGQGRQITAERDAIIKGKQVYAGPLADRDGKERVSRGQVLSDADLWKMDWFVKGVVTQ